MVHADVTLHEFAGEALDGHTGLGFLLFADDDLEIGHVADQAEVGVVLSGVVDLCLLDELCAEVDLALEDVDVVALHRGLVVVGLGDDVQCSSVHNINSVHGESFHCEARCLFAFACLTRWLYYAIQSVL